MQNWSCCRVRCGLCVRSVPFTSLHKIPAQSHNKLLCWLENSTCGFHDECYTYLNLAQDCWELVIGDVRVVCDGKGARRFRRWRLWTQCCHEYKDIRHLSRLLKSVQRNKTSVMLWRYNNFHRAGKSSSDIQQIKTSCTNHPSTTCTLHNIIT